MTRNASVVLGAAVAAWLIGPMLLGTSSAGVEMGNGPVSPGMSDQPEPPPCVSAHTYDSRSWPGLQMLRSDVWVTGCKDAAGQLRVTSGPTCSATSFMGPGTATCTAVSQSGGLKVTVHVTYPFGLNSLAGQPSATAFTLSPTSWAAVAP
jgi:hypothetical protein